MAQSSPFQPKPTPQIGKTIIGALMFLGKRLSFGIAALLAIIYLSHLGLDMARGTTLGKAAAIALSKTIAYLGQLFQGDLGLTQAGVFTGLPSPVSEVLPGLLAKSLGLLGVSLALASIIGVSLGLLAAKQRRNGWSLGIIILSIVGVSIPSFFAALLLQILAIQWTRKMGSPLLPLGGFGWDSHIILPALVLAARPVAQITRVTFLAIGEVLDQDFVRAARGKGLRESVILYRHVIRNAAISILTTIGLSLRFSLSSLPVVEFFFGWSGLGYVLLKAISQKDDNLTVALALSLGVIFILMNLVLDGLYQLIDPRLRNQSSARKKNSRAGFSFKSLLADLPAILADNPINRQLKAQQSDAKENPLKHILAQKTRRADDRFDPAGADKERRRTLLRGTIGNFPFAIGGILVLLLLAVVILGPVISRTARTPPRG